MAMKKRRGTLRVVRCIVCNHQLKRRKYRKTGIGPRCAEKLRNGYAGIQLKAFEPIPEAAKL
jgi:uncharacterized CHY-type Zn-finger protein